MAFWSSYERKRFLKVIRAQIRDCSFFRLQKRAPEALLGPNIGPQRPPGPPSEASADALWPKTGLKTASGPPQDRPGPPQDRPGPPQDRPKSGPRPSKSGPRPLTKAIGAEKQNHAKTMEGRSKISPPATQDRPKTGPRPPQDRLKTASRASREHLKSQDTAGTPQGTAGTPLDTPKAPSAPSVATCAGYPCGLFSGLF